MSTTFPSQAIRTKDYELDEFGKVVWSNVILWRPVVNDANVGTWKPFIPLPNEGPALTVHTLEGLKSWMDKSQDVWDSARVCRDDWDAHVYSHGLRLQFWIPGEATWDETWDEMNVTRGISAIPNMVTCLDATGVGLTVGKTYLVKGYKDELYLITDDNGADTEFLRERFRE